MLKISRKTAAKAAVATLLSVAVSVAIVLLLVPPLGGHPDGPGFWMSVLCPLLIAGPASTWQFHQTEMIARARDDLAHTHQALDRAHRELSALHEALTVQARTDALTGGLNREAMFATLERSATRSGGRVALLVADADHFKAINDTVGHLGGDEALRAIGRAIADTVGLHGRWGRIGGEEFMVLLQDALENEAAALAEAIRAQVAGLGLSIGGRAMSLTVSIGLAEAATPVDPIELYRLADQNLYRAKAAGRNSVVAGAAQARA